MKRKRITSLVLRKHKISNLQKSSRLIGGTDTATEPTDVNYNAGTTVYETCPSCDLSQCATNDTTRSLQTPTIVLNSAGCSPTSDEV
jgi:hypothetical protein